MTEAVSELGLLRARVAAWRRAGLRVGFVPTMGNLHAGHRSLVAVARGHADRVVASVFVNPMQFGPGEDFGRYPRTPGDDVAALAAAGCDLAWLPTVEAMYPLGTDQAVRIRVPGVAEGLEGACRPGHFDGVATVVARLFLQVQPDVAVFGSKDYQQLAVIRHLVADLAFPVAIVAAPTVREADGLAMSSRNQYLDDGERRRAPELHRVLQGMRDAVLGGEPAPRVERGARERLEAAGFAVDYAVLRSPALGAPAPGGPWVALVAARLGSTRLIDNLAFERD